MSTVPSSGSAGKVYAEASVIPTRPYPYEWPTSHPRRSDGFLLLPDGIRVPQYRCTECWALYSVSDAVDDATALCEDCYDEWQDCLGEEDEVRGEPGL